MENRMNEPSEGTTQFIYHNHKLVPGQLFTVRAYSGEEQYAIFRKPNTRNYVELSVQRIRNNGS